MSKSNDTIAIIKTVGFDPDVYLNLNSEPSSANLMEDSLENKNNDNKGASGMILNAKVFESQVYDQYTQLYLTIANTIKFELPNNKRN